MEKCYDEFAKLIGKLLARRWLKRTPNRSTGIKTGQNVAKRCRGEESNSKRNAKPKKD